jgi:hypothetical protein
MFVRAVFFTVMFFAAGTASGNGPMPMPPCGSEPVPAFPLVGQAPNTGVWSDTDVRLSGWQPPDCLRWASGRTRLVAALAGQFPFAGSIDDLAARLGRVSALGSLRYWSVSHGAWRELASEAGVLDGPAGNTRPDISASELVPGRSFFYYENNSGRRIVHRLTVLEHTADRIALSTENVTPIRVGILTVFEPGSMQSTIFVVRRAPGHWGYFQAIRVTEAASSIASRSPASYVNRLAALYRYVAGIPTDQDPPAAR